MEEKILIDYVKKVSPGTPLRNVINDLIGAGLGALIVFDNSEVQKVIEGGFRVNCKFTSQKLFELCKMDGAIIITPDLKRILAANVVLTPDSAINSDETGTRHKAAEKTAKQANTFVIAVSERRKKTTLYFSNTKYYLKNSDELLRDTSANLQVLEKQREVFDELITRLNVLEMSELVSVSDICKILQRAEIILKIAELVKRNFTELGKEGNVMNVRYRELLKDIEKIEDKIIRDYSKWSLKKTRVLLSNLNFDGLLELEAIAKLILEEDLDETASPCGYRFLSHLSTTEKQISEIVNKFQTLDNVFKSESKDLEEIFQGDAEKIRQEVDEIRTQILEGKITN